MRRFGVVIFAALMGAGLAREAQAQAIRRTGHGTPRLDARLDRLLSDDTYRVLSRDTVIAAGDTLAGPILSLANRLVIEGTITGDLAIIDANVYARPTARIQGNLINIGGGFYRSEQAVITGSLDDHPLAPYHVERQGETLVVVGDVERKLIGLNPMVPLANRVNGFQPRLGATVYLPLSGRTQLELFGWGSYAFDAASGRRFQGGSELRLRRGLTELAFGIEETTATNDAWIRSDFKTLISFMWEGKDYRNYYDAQRQYVTLSRDLVRGSHEAVLWLRAQREDAASLSARDPWTVLDPDSVRVNPSIDDGILASGFLGLSGEWTGVTAVAEYDGALEIGREGVVDGDRDFGAFTVWGKWAMQGLADHTIEIETRVQGPLPGTDSLPLQRWGMLGGSGTLYTFEIGEFFGDRLVYFETEYSIPIRWIRLPVIRSPRIELLHNIGMAWTHNESRDFEQNVGLRLQFPFVFARAIVNPADLDDRKFSVGVTIPRRAYPWERRGQ